MSTGVVRSGLIYVRFPNEKKANKRWSKVYAELITSCELQLYDSRDHGSQEQRRGSHLRSLKIETNDLVVEEKTKRSNFQFSLRRVDGQYFFKCSTSDERALWILQLQRAVAGQGQFVLAPLTHPTSAPSPDPPVSSCYALAQSQENKDPPSTPLLPSCYALVQGYGGLQSTFSGSLPDLSNLSTFESGRQTPTTPSSPLLGRFTLPNQDYPTPTPSPLLPKRSTIHVTSRPEVRMSLPADMLESLEHQEWFWGHMNRDQCKRRLMSEGKIKEYVIRLNDRGDFVMSVRRADNNVHHHIITWNGASRKFTFKGTSRPIEACTLRDLLDIYPVVSGDKIVPFGSSANQESSNIDPPYMTIPDIQSEVAECGNNAQQAPHNQPLIQPSIQASTNDHGKKNTLHPMSYTARPKANITKSASFQNGISQPPPTRPKPKAISLTPDLMRRMGSGKTQLARSMSASSEDLRKLSLLRQHSKNKQPGPALVSPLVQVKSEDPLYQNLSTAQQQFFSGTTPTATDNPEVAHNANSTEPHANPEPQYPNPDYMNWAMISQSSNTGNPSESATAEQDQLMADPEGVTNITTTEPDSGIYVNFYIPNEGTYVNVSRSSGSSHHET